MHRCVFLYNMGQKQVIVILGVFRHDVKFMSGKAIFFNYAALFTE